MSPPVISIDYILHFDITLPEKIITLAFESSVGEVHLLVLGGLTRRLRVAGLRTRLDVDETITVWHTQAPGDLGVQCGGGFQQAFEMKDAGGNCVNLVIRQ